MVLAAAAALTGAVVQSATGFGFALVVSPALFAVLEPYEAVTATLALGVLLNLLVLFDGRELGAVRWGLIAPPLVAAIPGLALGVAALELLSKPVLQLIVGATVLGFALQRLVRREEAAGPGRPLAAAGTGLAGGVLATSVSVSGPPFVLWLERRGLAPGDLRATLSATFLVLNLGGAAVLLVVGGLDNWLSPGMLLPLLGLVVAGHYAGALVFRRLDAARFRLVVLGVVALAGLASLAAGLAAV